MGAPGEESLLKAISLYTGVGGLDFGFEAAGFRTAVAVEMDPVCCSTLRLNRKWPVLEGDIHEFDSELLLQAADLRAGDADVLIAGPPCQPFSKSGYWSTGDVSRLDDPRSDTLTAYLRVLRDIRPKAFLLENVQGLAYKGKDEGLQHLLEGIHEVNRQAGAKYSVSWGVLNAAELGVPQQRERVLLIGARDGTPFVFPEPTHGDESDVDLFTKAREPYHTAWDAIGDLPEEPDDESLQVCGKWGDLLPTIPEGENYLWHTPRGGGYPLFGWRTRFWSFLLKLAKSRPAWTIQAQPGTATGPFHWHSRRLTAHEMCRLQTFPDGLSFDCGRSAIQRMLGNAVPSLLAELLAMEIRYQLLGSRRRLRPPKLMPPRREPVPAPEKVISLPRKYEALIGDHRAHPGEGRGPAARRRESQAPDLL